MNHGFYVYLPSNASPIEFPNNRVNHFRVRFEKPLHFPNYAQWEVALIELSYVHSLQTLRGDETVELVAAQDRLLYDGEMDIINPRVEGALYGDEENNSFTYWFYPPNHQLGRIRGKFCFYLTQPGTRAELSSRYAMHLGFKPLAARKLPEGYEKPVEPSSNPPDRFPGQTDVEHAADLKRYNDAKASYEKDKEVYAKYLIEEEAEPPFVFYHKERELEAKSVGTEVCNQYDFPPGSIDSVLPVAKLRLYRPAAGYTVMKSYKMRKGHYRNAESLLKEMIRTLGDSERYVKWSYFESNNRFSVTVNSEYHLRLHPRLASVLGFKTKDDSTYLELKAGGTYEAELTPDLLRGTYHMYVYTDTTELAIVGHQQAALLRAVPLQDVSYGTVKTFSFHNPIYERVAKSHMETVEVMLCDDAGELLPLDEGKTFMVLHFRPCQT